MLTRFAHALEISVDYLKNMEEEASTVIFENVENFINNESQGTYANIGNNIEDNKVSNFNPIEKVVELYERLLKEKEDKYNEIERRLKNLEQNLKP